MQDIVIIGAGASGLACALELKRLNNKLDITILERLDKIGKKILASGNGRCNLSNEDISSNNYISNNNVFLNSIDYNESKIIIRKFFTKRLNYATLWMQ